MTEPAIKTYDNSEDLFRALDERSDAELKAARDTPSPRPWAVCVNPPNDSWYKGITIYSVPEGTRVADACTLTGRAGANAALIVADSGAAAERDQLVATNKKLLDVLEFYADPDETLDEHGDLIQVPDFYDELDFGAEARAAIAKAGCEG